jgi:hypothetical protein
VAKSGRVGALPSDGSGPIYTSDKVAGESVFDVFNPMDVILVTFTTPAFDGHLYEPLSVFRLEAIQFKGL